ncbi:MAG TPA: PAS domain S-box protein [Stenomitos sp.]
MLNLWNPQLRRYGVAGLVVVLVLLLKLLLELQIKVENPFLLFFPAVMFSTWYGGLGPGLFATLTTGLLCYYFFVDLNSSLLFSSVGRTVLSELIVGQSLPWVLKPEQSLQLGLYLLQALLYSWLIGVRQGRQPQHESLETTPRTLVQTDPAVQNITEDFPNLSDSQQGEEILRQSEEHLRLVVQNMPVMMDAFDAEKNIIVWNRECERVTGYSAEEIIGNPQALKQLYPNAAYREQMFAEQGARVQNYRNWEWTITCKDGTVKTIAWSNISAEFPIPGWVTWGIGVDVTERQAALGERQQTEEALKNSQERLLLAQKIGKIGTFEWNLQTHELIWTQELEALYGLAPGNFGGRYKDWLKAIHPEDRARAKQQVRCILTQGLDFNMEYRIFWPDGSLHWIASRARVFQDDTGKPQRMIGVNMDITERKQAEEALKESELRFRIMFNQAAVGIALVALDGYFIQVNPAMCNITGYSRAELLQLTVQEISHPDEQQSDAAYLQRVLEREINGYSVQKRFFCKDGSIVWVNVTVSVMWDSNGSPKYGIGIIEDIRDRKHAEASQQFLVEASSLLAASLDYQTTLRNVAHLAIPTLADWCLVDMFQADSSIRQIAIACTDPAKQATLNELRRRYPPDPKTHNPVWQRLLQGQSILYPELTESQMVAMAQDNEHLQLLKSLGRRSVMIVPIQSRQQVLGVISFASSALKRRYNPTDLALAEDIARRAATAIDNARLYRDSEAARNAAQEANRMKDEFLAILSHELRSPLNAILGWTQMLRTRKFGEAATARALETIERNARAQTQLIEDLLDVSRIIRGKLNLNIYPLNLASVIEAAMNTVGPAADAKGIHMEFISTAGTRLISGDAGRLQQVVWNLLSNAIKFTPQGGRVQVGLDSTHAHTQITVTDTGKGISPDFLPQVFDRFRQADSTTTRSYGGLGLGLAIVRHLVELHGGTVQAESLGEGQGATFIVQLPLLEPSKDVSQSESLSPPYPLPNAPSSSELCSANSTAPHPLRGLRVLVVDDEADTRDFLSTVLELYGAQVRIAASVSQAISEIERLPPDVLVSDVGLPGEDGYSLIRKVRALTSERGGLIPAVAVTAYAREEDVKQAIAAGFQRHIPKPVESSQLVAVVAHLAGRIEEN